MRIENKSGIINCVDNGVIILVSLLVTLLVVHYAVLNFISYTLLIDIISWFALQIFITLLMLSSHKPLGRTNDNK
jgi:hypothetical protein